MPIVRISIAEQDFDFAPQRTPHAFNAACACATCGWRTVFRNGPACTDAEALGVAQMIAYRHLRSAHPEALDPYLEPALESHP